MKAKDPSRALCPARRGGAERALFGERQRADDYGADGARGMGGIRFNEAGIILFFGNALPLRHWKLG